jgi:apolipoprotein N-acyltransferase
VPIFGELGLQLIVLLLAALSTLAMRKALLSIFSLTVVGLALNYITWYQPTGEHAKLALVQGNIEQSMKWQADNEMPTMLKYYEMSQPYLENTDILIWPEAAVPRLEVLATEYLKEVDRVSAQANSAIITGSVDYQPDTNFAFNNLLVLGKKYEDDQYGHYRYLDNNRYSKHHLLPIGEFVPFESVLRTLAPIFDLPMSSFSRGSYQQDNLIANDVRLSPAICFEIAFPEQVRANLYDDSDVILTVSNDAWFGDSHGPWQHLQIAQMRALEFAMPVIRATNNGVTAVIGSDGGILAQLPQNQAAVLTHELALVSSYTPFKRFGNGLTWLCLLILSTLVWFVMRRTKNAR